MKVAKTVKDYNLAIHNLNKNGGRIGFIPTMGALHPGHISLIKLAKKSCDIIVVSIFVNPTQFNNSADFELYPRTIEDDLLMLENIGVDIVFTPESNEIYPNGFKSDAYNLGSIETVLEGQFRPGHFQGVATIVDKLFNIVNPTFAFFGEKDLQQVAVIKQLVSIQNFKIEIVVVPTQRNEFGLALSSRNKRLSEKGLKTAEIIYESLIACKSLVSFLDPQQALNATKQKLRAINGLELEYAEIINPITFETINSWSSCSTPHICIACYIENVRLIDNMRLID